MHVAFVWAQTKNTLGRCGNCEVYAGCNCDYCYNYAQVHGQCSVPIRPTVHPTPSSSMTVSAPLIWTGDKWCDLTVFQSASVSRPHRDWSSPSVSFGLPPHLPLSLFVVVAVIICCCCLVLELCTYRTRTIRTNTKVLMTRQKTTGAKYVL